MTINRVYIKSFGGVSEKEYILSDGLNVIYGENESGKSTFLAFLRFIFYGAKKSRGKELTFREKYMPWSGEDMCGEVEFTSNGAEYSLSRKISATGRKKDAVLINKTTGDTVDIDGDEIGSSIFKMSEEAFLKTLFLGAEGAKISSDGELLSKIANVAQSGDEKISYQAVRDEINNAIADISSSRRSKAIIPTLEKQIEDLEAKKAEVESLYEQKNSLSQKLTEISANLDNAINIKSKLTSLKTQSNQYDDYAVLETAKAKLSDAENAYKNTLSNDINTDVSSISDKAKGAKILSIVLLTLSAISLSGLIISPYILFVSAVLASVGIYFLLSNKKLLNTAEEILELKNSKIQMAKNIFEERKAELLALTEKLNKKYGSTDNLKCEPIEIDRAEIDAQLTDAEEKIITLTAESAKLKSNADSTDGLAEKIISITKEIEDLSSAKKDAEDKLRILNLAADILDQSYEELKSNFAPKLAKSTARIFNALTGGKYGELIVNDAFEIQVKNDGKYENSNFFSSGTIQQLYFSLRLGIIELIMGNYPLFIDDAFITYDDKRFKNASDFLKEYSRENQIVFCTCHKRESETAGACVLKF